MSKSTNFVTEVELKAIQTPAKTATYTPITHGWIIAKCKSEFKKLKLELVSESYMMNHNGTVARGTYVIKDNDITLTFSWVNSYDKSTKFQCAVGGYNFENDAAFIPEHMNNWIRKHTGTADVEAGKIIDEQMSKIGQYKKELISIKEKMIHSGMTDDQFMFFLSKLFFKFNMIGSEDLSALRNEINKPTFTSASPMNTVWYKYNVLLNVIKTSHPKSWLLQQTFINSLLMTDYVVGNLSKVTSQNNDLQEVLVELSDDQIEMIEAEYNTQDESTEVIEEEVIDDSIEPEELIEEEEEYLEEEELEEIEETEEEEVSEEILMEETPTEVAPERVKFAIDLSESDEVIEEETIDEIDESEELIIDESEEELLEEFDDLDLLFEDDTVTDETISDINESETKKNPEHITGDSEDGMFDAFDNEEIVYEETALDSAKGEEFEDDGLIPWEDDDMSPDNSDLPVEEASDDSNSDDNIKKKIELYLSDMFEGEDFTYTKQGSIFIVTLESGIELEVSEKDI